MDLPAVPTEQRLLDAAGEVFAARGFQNATVREICARAEANIAAVNYHFGDKLGLYVAVVRRAVQRHAPIDPHDRAWRRLPAPERLRRFVEAKLLQLTGERPAWADAIINREVLEPSPAFDEFAREVVGPQYRMLLDIVRDLVPRAAPETLHRCARSVVSQCVFYCHARHLIAHLEPGFRLDRDTLPALVEHITAFCLRGLAGMARAREPAT